MMREGNEELKGRGKLHGSVSRRGSEEDLLRWR